MRNQYKVLSEKYDQVQEAERHPQETQETVEMVNKVLSCKTYEDLLKALSPYYERYRAYITGNKHWYDMDILAKVVSSLPLPETVVIMRGKSITAITSTPTHVLQSMIMAALHYIHLLASDKKEDAKKYEYYPKIMWSEWWDIYKPVLDAIDSIKQKNQETGINLDI